MLEFYAEIKWVHVAAVLASGALFLIRGIAVQGGARWSMAAPVRYLSYGIDSILLTAAFMLLTILPAAVFITGWLYLKLALLVAYVVLGSFALKRGRTRRARLAFFLCALAVFAWMLGVARAHHPLGPVHLLLT